MDAREITDAKQWGAFVAGQAESQFLQSWRWGEFQQAVGRTVVRTGITSGTQLLAVAQCIIQDHGFGVRSLSVYRGPLVDAHLDIETFTQSLEALLASLDLTAREHRVSYIHLEVPADIHAPFGTLFTERPGWSGAPSTQPAHSQLLPLDRDTISASPNEKA